MSQDTPLLQAVLDRLFDRRTRQPTVLFWKLVGVALLVMGGRALYFNLTAWLAGQPYAHVGSGRMRVQAPSDIGTALSLAMTTGGLFTLIIGRALGSAKSGENFKVSRRLGCLIMLVFLVNLVVWGLVAFGRYLG